MSEHGTERHKERKTERWKYRKTERQKEGKTERRKDGKTKREKTGKTERLKDGKFYNLFFQSPIAAAVLDVGTLVQSPTPKMLGYLTCCKVS